MLSAWAARMQGANPQLLHYWLNLVSWLESKLRAAKANWPMLLVSLTWHQPDSPFPSERATPLLLQISLKNQFSAFVFPIRHLQAPTWIFPTCILDCWLLILNPTEAVRRSQNLWAMVCLTYVWNTDVPAEGRAWDAADSIFISFTRCIKYGIHSPAIHLLCTADWADSTYGK